MRWDAALACLRLFVTALSWRPQEVVVAHTSPSLFPSGTIFVIQDAIHGHTYFATNDFLQEVHSRNRFSFRGRHYAPEAVAASPNGKFLLVRTTFDSYLLDAATLRLVRENGEGFAWWEGARLGHLCYRDGRIITGGHKFRANWGRTALFAADSTGHYFLGTHTIRRGNIYNAGTPTQRLLLWKKTKKGTLRIDRSLATLTYDPGSSGDSRRLETLSRDVAVFGVPNGAADNDDFVGVLRKGHVAAPLRDDRGRRLEFTQCPILMQNAIVGIAEAVNAYKLLTGAKYAYLVSRERTLLKRLPKNVVFVTYDTKQKRIGWGLTVKGGVSVVYKHFTSRNRLESLQSLSEKRVQLAAPAKFAATAPRR